MSLPEMTLRSRPLEDVSDVSSQMRRVYRRLAAGGMVVLVGKTLGAVFGLGVSSALARLLSPDDFGTYYLALSLASLGTVFAEMGLTQTVVRLVAESLGTQRPGRARAAVRIVVRLVLVSALVSATALAVGIGPWLADVMFHSRLPRQLVELAALWAIALTFRNLLAETLRGFSSIALATVFGGMLTSLLSLVLFGCSWLIVGTVNVSQAVSIAIVTTAMASLVAGLAVSRRTRSLCGPGEVQVSEVVAAAVPQLLTSVMLYTLSNSGVWLLGAFRGEGDVAIYGAVTRLVTLVATPLVLVNAVVMPMIAEMYAQGRKTELERLLRASATVSSLPSVLLLVGLLLGRGSILALVFGNYYRAGGTALLALSLGQLVNALAGSCGITLMMTGHQKAMMLVTVTSGATTIAMGLAVVRQYGPSGVAAVSAAGLILQNVLMVLAAKQKTGMWTHVMVPTPSFMKALRDVL